ncbi:MAG: STAS domain-containing protein [Solirubrobacteraceae bacterium]
MEGSLHIDIAQRNAATVLSVLGEVDLATAQILDEQISAVEAGDATTIVVDLDRVSFMDSSGLQVLLAHVFSHQNGSRIRLTRGSPQVVRLFTVSGMLGQLPFVTPD